MSNKQEEVVKTFDGTEALRGECRHIKGEFYKVGDPKVKDSGQCFLINGRYYRLSTGYIVYDEFNNEYVLNNDSITAGVVGIDDKGNLIKGHFTPNVVTNVLLVDKGGESHLVINEDVLLSNRAYRYDKSRDRYAHISTQDAKAFNRFKEVSSDYKNSLHYDCREIISRYTSEYNKCELSISDHVTAHASVLDNLTFGLEFETVRGVVPERITRGLGLIPLRDGSIEGLEYATIPYAGAKGLMASIEACKALNKFTKYDESCSLHLHMGGIPRTEEYLLALFKVLCLVQDEFFEMFPLYKKYNFGVKRKNYTQPFQAINMMAQFDKVITPSNIKANFDVLYRFLSRGQSYRDVGEDLRNVKGHPSDPRGTSKWNITSRYYWVNLIPIVFGNKQTVEFRIHTPTTDYNKVINYIFMCGGILNYVRQNQKTILDGKVTTLSLSDIVIRGLKGGSDRLMDCMMDYMSLRKQGTLNDNYEGNIRGDEKKIASGYFDWNSSKKAITKRKPSSGSYLGMDTTMDTDFIEPPSWIGTPGIVDQIRAEGINFGNTTARRGPSLTQRQIEEMRREMAQMSAGMRFGNTILNTPLDTPPVPRPNIIFGDEPTSDDPWR